MCRRRSIFPGRLHPSIFDVSELNFRVRNGNGWFLTAIDTDYIYISKDEPFEITFNDPYGNRTHDCAVRGRRLSLLTNGPYGCTIGDSNPGPTD